MFYIYGVSGQSFVGSMEQLRYIDRPGAVGRTRAIKGIKRDGLDPDAPAPQSALHTPPVAPRDEANRMALAAYAQSQKAPLPRHTLRLVNELMSHKVVTVADSATVLQAWRLLTRQGLSQAPVVNAAGVLIGLLCLADWVSPEVLPLPDSDPQAWQTLMQQPVSDIMWSPVPSVGPDADIRRVTRVLLDTQLPGMAVVDEQGLVIGFVSRTDILRAVVTDPPLDLWG
jgi:CBS-domain-containing membrane protein